jgi:ESCRT-I complex subunit VPS37
LQNKANESEKELLLASNRSLADFNLSYEPKLREGKERFLQLSERAQELCNSVQAMTSQLGNAFLWSVVRETN